MNNTYIVEYVRDEQQFSLHAIMIDTFESELHIVEHQHIDQ